MRVVLRMMRSRHLDPGELFGSGAVFNTLVNQALEHPDVKAKLATLACDPAPSTPEAFATRVTADVARWKKLASDRNIRAD